MALAQPYLVKIAHRPAHRAESSCGVGPPGGTHAAILVAAFAAEYIQTWTMQLTGQRIMFDLRMALYGHLQRLDVRYYDRNPVGA